MKNYLSILSLFFVGLFCFSCSNNAGNMQFMAQMKDTIFNAYPKIASVLINVQEDKRLIITIGSKSLYQADEATRKDVANNMGAMALRIFGKENRLEEGEILVTDNETNQEVRPEGAIQTPMDFNSLRNSESNLAP